MSELVEKKGKVLFKNSEFVNFIITIFMKCFPTAMEKLPEK